MVSEQVLALKSAGNTLYVQKKWAEARSKYTEAIESEGGDTVPELFCNRAACLFQLKKHRSAIMDANSAIKLNKLYTKAWARKGAAYMELQEYDEAMAAYVKAHELLSALPNPTDNDEKLKSQYSLNIAEAKRFSQNPRVSQLKIQKGSSPFDIAEEIIHSYRAKGEDGRVSSAWVVASSWQDFRSGIDIMDQMQTIRNSDGDIIYGTRSGAVQDLSNGMLRDQRCVLTNKPDFMKLLDIQVRGENDIYKGWLNIKDRASIKGEAKDRLRNEGWKSVRPALAVTVRSWILQAFLLSVVEKDDVALQAVGAAIELLEWGRAEFANIPREERGSIFESTFLAGVRKFYAKALLRAHLHRPSDKDEAAWLKEYLEVSAQLLKDVQCSMQGVASRDQIPPDMLLCFYHYPRAEAFALRGKYEYKKAYAYYTSMKTDEDMSNAVTHGIQACKSYVKAADILPRDEEERIVYLKAAVDSLFLGSAPLSQTIPIMKRLKEEYPNISPLWDNSGLALSGRNESVEYILEFLESALVKVEKGEYGLDDGVTPKGLNLVPWFIKGKQAR